MRKRIRIFGVSCPRTGTSSLAYAIRKLGLNTGHYFSEEWYRHIHEYEFANDFPITFRYKELDERFPGSKFIYSDRPVDDWLKSYELHLERTGHLTIGNWQEYNKEMFGGTKFDKEHFRKVFLNHREEVFEYFKDRPDDLLVLKMPYDIKSWGEIARFIGVPYPKGVHIKAFPHKCGSYSESNPWCPSVDRKSDPAWC